MPYEGEGREERGKKRKKKTGIHPRSYGGLKRTTPLLPSRLSTVIEF